MRTGYKMLVCLLCVITVFSSCKRNRYRINTSGISAGLEIKRLEKDLFEPDPSEINAEIPGLKVKYGSFLQLFSYVINAGNINDPAFSDVLTGFCTDKLNNEVYSAVMKEYPDIEWLKRDLEDAFRHYLWYFPGKHLPSVYTCITGFNNSIITGDSALGISLDRYLGRDCKYYAQLQIYRYIAARMNSYNILSDCMYAWGSTEWDFKSMNYQADNVINEIVHEGKLKYFEKCMLPEVSDTLIFGFTAGQLKFCRNNESQMWNYLLEHNMLFQTDLFTIRKLTGEAPFTSFFTSESPGRASVWIGFRIVESYMMRNKNVTLEELMKNTDVQALLSGSKYRPG